MNKTRLKKTIFVSASLILLVLAGLFFTECGKDDKSMNPKLDIYKQIGEEHNKGLDFVLQNLEAGALSRNNIQKSENVVAIYAEAENLAYEFLNSASGLSEENKEYAVSAMQSLNITTQTNTKNENLQHLSDTQQKYIQKLHAIVNKEKLDLTKSLKKIKALEEDILQECQDSDQYILLSATSIARHSMQYWHDNYKTWIAKLCYEKGVISKATRLKNGPLPKGNPYEGRPDGLYEYPYDPSCYVQVLENEAYLCVCPPGLHFNQDLCICDYPWNISKEYSWRNVVIGDIDGATISMSAVITATLVSGPASLAAAIATAVGGSLAGSVGKALDELRRWFNL